MKKKIQTNCCVCNREIYRSRTNIVSKYGTFKPKCKECKKIDRKVKEYIDKQGERVKLLYHTDPDYRKQLIERAIKRYWDRRQPSLITEEEMIILNSLNSYPVVVPGNLGTDNPTTNLKIIEVDGKKRVRGAVWLENFRKNVF